MYDIFSPCNMILRLMERTLSGSGFFYLFLQNHLPHPQSRVKWRTLWSQVRTFPFLAMSNSHDLKKKKISETLTEKS